MSFRTPVENPGTRPPRSRVFDIACTLLAAAASFGSFSFAQGTHPPFPTLAVSLIVAVLTAAVPAQWPVRTELFQVAPAISLYTVAVTMSRITGFVAGTLAAAVGQSGWLAAIYERSIVVRAIRPDRAQPKELQRKKDRARTGCSAPLGRPRLCINRQRIVGRLYASSQKVAQQLPQRREGAG